MNKIVNLSSFKRIQSSTQSALRTSSCLLLSGGKSCSSASSAHNKSVQLHNYSSSFSRQSVLRFCSSRGLVQPQALLIRQMSSAAQETHDSPASSQEKKVGVPEKHEFMAETRQLLNIVAKSLYSEKEVFIRELISNSSDALEKLKYAQLTNTSGTPTSDQVASEDIPFEIQINANDINNTLTIQDTGLGMTKEELIKNLGTIAHSGSKAFLETLAKNTNGASSSNDSSIIGQFGVGFYSAFMVADKVEVFTQSYKPGEKAYEWVSTGDGSYELTEVDGVQRGTKIVLHLKSECSEFSREETIKSIVNKYSNFVGYPIVVNGDRINIIQPLWLEDSKNITEEQHEEFYRFIGNLDKPRYTFQYKTDAPLNIRALFYIPQFKPAPGEINQESDVGVSLYSKKVLILSKATQILPRWLRFLKGVVDSEDIPLNLSRELLQDSNLIRKLRTILTQRILRFLSDQAKEDEEKFKLFYADFNLYFKEAIMRTTDQAEKEEIASLLRFETNKTEPGVSTTLNDYIKRMKPDQNNIFFFAAPSRELAMNSPYFEAIKQKDNEVLFLFEPYDEMIILQLNQYHRKNLVGIEQENVADKNKDDLIIEGDERSLSNDQAQELKNWLKTSLGNKIKGVKITNKLETHPCVVTTENMGVVRHMIKSNYFQREKIQDFYSAVNLSLEINPRNSLIKSLYTLHKKDPELAKAIAEQLLDNSMVSAGLIEDPRLVLSNMNKLLEKAFAK